MIYTACIYFIYYIIVFNNYTYMYIYIYIYIYPEIPTPNETMGVEKNTIAYLRVLIFEIGSTIILMVVEAQGIYIHIFGG